MPIYQVTPDGLQPYQRLMPGADLYEKQIEALAWADLEAFTGEALFPVARQPRIPGGGIPDIVALTASGSVVIIEVKRDVDRGQLAQVLEYAGWARLASLDEIAALYNLSQTHRILQQSLPTPSHRTTRRQQMGHRPNSQNPRPSTTLLAQSRRAADGR